MEHIHKVRWTLGNFLIVVSLYLLLFVGGLRANESYNVYAASGATEAVEFPVAVAERPLPLPTAATTPTPTTNRAAAPAAPLDAEVANPSSRTAAPIEAQVTPEKIEVPAVAESPAKPVGGPSTVSRIIIPRILVDRKVAEVGWTVQPVDGVNTIIWDVETYRVGHHKGTSNPGDGSNIVLSGHSGGNAYAFNDLNYLVPGDEVQLFSNGQVYPYSVSEHILLDEEGQPLSKRLANAQYLAPTTEEMVTMVACWPLSGPDKFKQRIVIRAKPSGPPSPAQ